MHALDVAAIDEKFRDLRCVFRMRAHSPRQGSHSPQNQPAIERRRDRAAFILNVANPLKEIVVAFCDHDSTENVAMPAEIFGGGVKNKIGADLERSLKNRRPGIVADAK